MERISTTFTLQDNNKVSYFVMSRKVHLLVQHHKQSSNLQIYKFPAEIFTISMSVKARKVLENLGRLHSESEKPNKLNKIFRFSKTYGYRIP